MMAVLTGILQAILGMTLNPESLMIRLVALDKSAIIMQS